MATPLEANVAAFLAVAVLGIALLLLGVSALSWRRLGHRRLLFVTAGFAVLAAQGALGAWRAAQGVADLPAAALDLALVLLLYGSLAAR